MPLGAEDSSEAVVPSKECLGVSRWCGPRVVGLRGGAADDGYGDVLADVVFVKEVLKWLKEVIVPAVGATTS